MWGELQGTLLPLRICSLHSKLETVPQSLPWSQTAAQLVGLDGAAEGRRGEWEGGLRSVLCVRKVKSTVDSGTHKENRRTSLCIRHSSFFTLKLEAWKLNYRQLPFSFLFFSLHSGPNYANIRALKEHQILVGGVLTSRSNPAMFTQGAWETLRF